MLARKKVKNITRDCLRFVLSKSMYIDLRFFFTHRYWGNFKNPRTFSEKLISRKLNCYPGDYSGYVDKFQVRQYVKSILGDEFLIPLLAKFDSIEPRKFIDLPNSFVIKTSNGGGGENVRIVRDKKSEDLPSLSMAFNSYLKEKIGSKIDENFYDVHKPYILIEKLLLDSETNSPPSDFKVHVFRAGGKYKILLQVDVGRFEEHKRSLFDENLSRVNISIQPKYKPIDINFQFPENIRELIDKAKILAKPFNYVRVDMYSVNGKIYFGELTFCHGSGWEKISSYEDDLLLGSFWMD